MYGCLCKQPRCAHNHDMTHHTIATKKNLSSAPVQYKLSFCLKLCFPGNSFIYSNPSLAWFVRQAGFSCTTSHCCRSPKPCSRTDALSPSQLISRLQARPLTILTPLALLPARHDPTRRSAFALASTCSDGNPCCVLHGEGMVGGVPCRYSHCDCTYQKVPVPRLAV